MITRIPAEAGPELARHLPVNPWKAWAFLLTLCFGFPVATLFMGGFDPILWSIVPPMFLLGFGYGFSEWIFLDYRIHQNALIVGCFLPGMRTVVIPFYSIDPDTLTIQPREKVPVGEARMAPDYRRGSPVCSHELRFNGIKTFNARRLAHWRHRKPFTTYLDNPYTDRWELVARGDGTQLATTLHNAIVAYRTTGPVTPKRPN